MWNTCSQLIFRCSCISSYESVSRIVFQITNIDLPLRECSTVLNSKIGNFIKQQFLKHILNGSFLNAMEQSSIKSSMLWKHLAFIPESLECLLIQVKKINSPLTRPRRWFVYNDKGLCRTTHTFRKKLLIEWCFTVCHKISEKPSLCFIVMEFVAGRTTLYQRQLFKNCDEKVEKFQKKTIQQFSKKLISTQGGIFYTYLHKVQDR